MGIVVEEADERLFWLELLVETGVVPKQKMEELLKEANELSGSSLLRNRPRGLGERKLSGNRGITQSLNRPITQS